MRSAEINRETKETNIQLKLNLDGTGSSKIDIPLTFLGHMLESFSKHSKIDIELTATGDVEIDDHHTAEDIGICLGQALDKALGDKRGLVRMAHSIVPMDDARAEVSIDLSGRPYPHIHLPFSEFHDRKVGDTSKENLVHFLESLSLNGNFNLNVKVEGRNDHHKVEAAFKALARAFYAAIQINGDDVPSTKGVI